MFTIISVCVCNENIWQSKTKNLLQHMDQTSSHLLQGHVASKGEMRDMYRILVGTAEGKRQCGIPSCRREIILKWLFKKQDSGVEWIDLAQDRGRWQALVNADIKCGEFLG